MVRNDQKGTCFGESCGESRALTSEKPEQGESMGRGPIDSMRGPPNRTCTDRTCMLPLHLVEGAKMAAHANGFTNIPPPCLTPHHALCPARVSACHHGACHAPSEYAFLSIRWSLSASMQSYTRRSCHHMLLSLTPGHTPASPLAPLHPRSLSAAVLHRPSFLASPSHAVTCPRRVALLLAASRRAWATAV